MIGPLPYLEARTFFFSPWGLLGQVAVEPMTSPLYCVEPGWPANTCSLVLRESKELHFGNFGNSPSDSDCCSVFHRPSKQRATRPGTHMS